MRYMQLCHVTKEIMQSNVNNDIGSFNCKLHVNLDDLSAEGYQWYQFEAGRF